MMLLEAWDGLSLESQMRALTRVANFRSGSQNRELIDKALASPNAYVRYLAARGDWLEHFGDIAPIWMTGAVALIEHDPSPLVRYARERLGPILWDGDVEEFCAQPREQRLARIRNADDSVLASSFADILRAAAKAAIPPDEFVELLEEWSGCERQASYFDPCETSDDDDVAELWDVVEGLSPIYKKAKYFLVYRLRMPDEEFSRRLREKDKAKEMVHILGLSPVQRLCLAEYCQWKLDDNADGWRLSLAYRDCARLLERLSPNMRAMHMRKLQVYELAKWLVPWPGQTVNRMPLPKELKVARSMIVPNDTWGTFKKLDGSALVRTTHGQKALDQFIGASFDENGFEAPSGNESHRGLFSTMNYLWLIGSGAITLVILIAMFGYARSAFETLTVGALAIIYSTVRGGGEAFMILARGLQVQFARISKLLNDPNPLVREEAPDEAARKQRSANITSLINIGFNFAIWAVAAWNILGVIL